MKTQFKKISILLLGALIGTTFTTIDTMAQKISVIANFKALDSERVEGDNGTSVSYKGETSLSGNVRIFDKNLWALRVGVGVDNLKYEFADNNMNTNYEVVRQNLTGYLGLEKHFKVAFLHPYAGVYVPITFNGEDEVKDIATDAKQQFDNGNIQAGFSILAGANVKLFRLLRLGLEFNAGFKHFKDEVIDNFSENSAIRFKNFDYNTEVTLGVAF